MTTILRVVDFGSYNISILGYLSANVTSILYDIFFALANTNLLSFLIYFYNDIPVASRISTSESHNRKISVSFFLSLSLSLVSKSST